MSSLSHLRASVIKSRTRLIYISFWYGKLEEIFYSPYAISLAERKYGQES
jgi:hypothetical protein